MKFRASHGSGTESTTPAVQGRPFREGIRENATLWWGLVAASTVAFSGATDFMPELNRWLQIVEMERSVCLPLLCLFPFNSS
jgi:hypothetical protein